MCARQKEAPPSLQTRGADRRKKLLETVADGIGNSLKSIATQPPASKSITTFAPVGVSNGSCALMKPKEWVARIHRNRSAKDRSGRLAGRLQILSRSSDRVCRRCSGWQMPCASARLRRSWMRQPRLTAWVVALCQNT